MDYDTEMEDRRENVVNPEKYDKSVSKAPSVVLDGELFDLFKISQGVPQGCIVVSNSVCSQVFYQTIC